MCPKQILMQPHNTFKIIIYDEAGKEVLVWKNLLLNFAIQQFLVKGVHEQKIVSPLIHKQSREWFYPTGQIRLKATEDNKTMLIQNEMVIFKFSGSIIEFETLSSIPAEKQFQNPKFIDSNEYIYNISMIVSELDSKVKVPLSFPVHSWKKDLLTKIVSFQQLFWHKSSTDTIRIFLTANDVSRYASEKNISLSSTESIENDLFFCVYTLEHDEADGSRGKVVTWPVQSFMRVSFIASSRTKNAPLPYAFAVLENSFSHTLSESGKKNLTWLKLNILQGYKKWLMHESGLRAPIASLSQGSGTGKSKLAVELIKSEPGFYTILRPDPGRSGIDHTAYPRNNAISELLKDLVEKSDPLTDHREFDYDSCSIGNILMLLAKIITMYLRDWHKELVGLILDDISASTATSGLSSATSKGPFPIADLKIVALGKAACEKLGKRFEKNDRLDCSFLKNADLENFIIRSALSIGRSKPKVKSISRYITNILNTPSLADFRVTKNDSVTVEQQAWIGLSKILESFPFVFIFDEANKLNIGRYKSEMTGFEFLRHALSHFEPGTKIFFLALGTNIDGYDLNPPIPERSPTIPLRDRSLPPIVLLSNSSLFSHEYPIDKVEIDQEIIKNPVLFKFLATLGHPLWSSVPFNEIRIVASQKLKNGCVDSLDYVLVIWMIRAGLMANPTGLNIKSLIATKLATLFDFSPDLINMIVFYPSEPIMAMTCRLLLSELRQAGKYHNLFSKLDEKLEAVKIDSGDLAEVVGSMLVLMAIDQAENSADVCESEPTIINQINSLSLKMPDFKSLWMKRDYILEPDYNNNKSFAKGFPGYHVVTVRNFLKKFVDEMEFTEIEGKLPDSTLKGLINASHSVKITRINDKLCFEEEGLFCPMSLPSADDRIPASGRDMIDDAMLKLGLARQCMFLMPDRYYGYDLVVPVVLEDGSFTFIGIQFKAAGRTDIVDPISKMQARHHYVYCNGASTLHKGKNCNLCPNKPCDLESRNDHSASCENCLIRKKRSSIYYNQITLLVGLDSSSSTKFASRETPFFKLDSKATETEKIYHDQMVDILRTALTASTVDESQSILKNFERDKSTKEIYPLFYKCETVRNNSQKAIISCLWNDEFVKSPPSENLKNFKVRPFYSDGFVHRQFCIAVRGIESFCHLFGYFANDRESSVKEASNLLNRNSHFFNRLNGQMTRFRNISILRSILFDASTNYLDYNSTLASWRGITQEPGKKGHIGYPLLMEVLKQYCDIGIENWNSNVFYDSQLNHLISSSALNRKEAEKTGTVSYEEGAGSDEKEIFPGAEEPFSDVEEPFSDEEEPFSDDAFKRIKIE